MTWRDVVFTAALAWTCLVLAAGWAIDHGWIQWGVGA